MTKQRLIDLLAMSRFANLPTVWSNAFTAFAAIFLLSFLEYRPSWLAFSGICFLLSCLYLGGCFLNDWYDSDFDSRTRPERPIPSGRWQRSHILQLASLLMLTGAAGVFFFSIKAGLFASLLLVSILLYTKWHKTQPISLIFMAGARLLTYPVAYFALAPAPETHSEWSVSSVHHHEWVSLASLAIPMGIYILGISLTARSESKSTQDRSLFDRLGHLCLIAPLFWASYLAFSRWDGHHLFLIPVALLAVVQVTICWRLSRQHDIGKFVSHSLASIPLVDFLFIGPFLFHLYPASPLAFLIFLTQPLLSLLALGLQRIAPAT